MKKFNISFMIMSLVLVGIMAFSTLYSKSSLAEEPRSKYIENSFNLVKKQFFEEARLMSDGPRPFFYIVDQTEPRTTSYYLMVNFEFGIVTQIVVKKEVKLGKGLIEIYSEKIYLYGYDKPYRYHISHVIMDQNNNCEETEKEPVRIWDETIKKFFFCKEDRVRYIRDSFETIKDSFFDKAEKVREGDIIGYFISNENIDNESKMTTSHYLTVYVDHLVPQYMLSIYARTEIRIDSVTEWYEEGIHLGQIAEKYVYIIDSGVGYQLENSYKEMEMPPAKIWDTIIKQFFK